MRKVTCQGCGAVFEVDDDVKTDQCCSDECWEKIYAPGPKEEENIEIIY